MYLAILLAIVSSLIAAAVWLQRRWQAEHDVSTRVPNYSQRLTDIGQTVQTCRNHITIARHHASGLGKKHPQQAAAVGAAIDEWTVAVNSCAATLDNMLLSQRDRLALAVKLLRRAYAAQARFETIEQRLLRNGATGVSITATAADFPSATPDQSGTVSLASHATRRAQCAA